MPRLVSDRVKQLRGTARPDRQRPATAGGGVRMPAGLRANKPAARAWRLIAAELGDRLRPVDGLGLHLLALHYGAAIAAAEELAAAGPVAKDAAHGGDKRNPAGVLFLQNSDRAIRLLREFGATPTAAALLPLNDAGPSIADLLFAELDR